MLVNTLTNSVFVASRRAKYSAFTDGIVGGIGKVIFAFVLAGAGTYGAFVASTMGVVLASVASLILIFTTMHSRLDLKRPLRTLKPLLKFSGANYIGNVFSMIPGLVVPVILLDRTGAESAAYFFVVFQIAQIVYGAALALEQTFLAEGSRANADMRGLKRRSRRILVMLCIPTAVECHCEVDAGCYSHSDGQYYQNGYISLDHSGSSCRPYRRKLLVPHRSPAGGQTSRNSWDQCDIRCGDMPSCLGWGSAWIVSGSGGMVLRRSDCGVCSGCGIARKACSASTSTA